MPISGQLISTVETDHLPNAIATALQFCMYSPFLVKAHQRDFSILLTRPILIATTSTDCTRRLEKLTDIYIIAVDKWLIELWTAWIGAYA